MSERWRSEAGSSGSGSGGGAKKASAAAGAKQMSMLTKDGKKRVVVTGMGVVSAHGNDVDAFYDKLLAGESAITKISEWEPHEDFATVIAGEIKVRRRGGTQNAVQKSPFISFHAQRRVHALFASRSVSRLSPPSPLPPLSP